MKKYNLIILAGGDQGPLFDTYGCSIKALLPIHGKPMLEWVVDAFKKSERIENAVIVGPSQLDNCENISFFRKRIFEGSHVLQNLMQAIAYIKFKIYKQKKDHDGYLISFCDAVFLTPQIIQDTVDRISSMDADIVLHYVEKESILKNKMPANRTFINLGNKSYTGTTIYYIKHFSPIFGQLKNLFELRSNRKDPKALLEVLGCKDESLESIEKELSNKLDLKVKICVSEHPRLGMDVDKPKDYLDALQILPSTNTNFSK